MAMATENEEAADAPRARARAAHPFVEASCASKLLFAWPRRLMTRGGAALAEADLPDVLPPDSSAANLDAFARLWAAEKARAARAARAPSLSRALLRDFLVGQWFVQPLMLLASASKLMQAVALGQLLQTFEDDGAGAGRAAAGNFEVSQSILTLLQMFPMWRMEHQQPRCQMSRPVQ